MVQVRPIEVVHVKRLPSPSSAVAVYCVTVAPPFAAGAVKDTDKVPSPGVTLVIVGALGLVLGVAAVDVELFDSPVGLVAVTVKV